MRGRLDVREIDEVGDATLSFDEVKALASGDPRVIEKARLDAEVATLERLERAHHRVQATLAFTAARAEATLVGLGTQLTGLDRALAARRATRAEAFHATLDGVGYTERAPYAVALAQALLGVAGAAQGVPGRTGTLGDLGGLALGWTTHRDRDGALTVDLEYLDAPGDPVTVTPAALDPRPLGVVSSLERRHAGLEERRRRVAAQAETLRAEGQRAAAGRGAGFPRAGELADKRARAAALREAMTDLARHHDTPDTPEPTDTTAAEGDESAGDRAAGDQGAGVSDAA